jgi:hypothetical protein
MILEQKVGKGKRSRAKLRCEPSARFMRRKDRDATRGSLRSLSRAEAALARDDSNDLERR